MSAERLHAMHLGGRVPVARLADAAYAGLQDTAPPVRLAPGPKATGVRLLPAFDPYLYGRPALQSGHRELVGALLVDGRIVGTWARQQHKVTVRPRSRAHLARIEEEARALAGPIGRPITLTVAME